MSRHLYSPPRIRLTESGPRESRTVPRPRAHRRSLLFTQGTAGAFTSERRLRSPSEQALGATARLTLSGYQQGQKRLHLPLTCTSHDGQGDSDLFKGTALPILPRNGQRVPKRNTLGVPRRNAPRVPKRNGTAAEPQRPRTSGTMVTSNHPSNLGVSGKVVHVDMLLKPLATHSAAFPSAPSELVRPRSRSGSSLPPLTRRFFVASKEGRAPALRRGDRIARLRPVRPSEHRRDRVLIHGGCTRSPALPDAGPQGAQQKNGPSPASALCTGPSHSTGTPSSSQRQHRPRFHVRSTFAYRVKMPTHNTAIRPASIATYRT